MTDKRNFSKSALASNNFFKDFGITTFQLHDDITESQVNSLFHAMLKFGGNISRQAEYSGIPENTISKWKYSRNHINFEKYRQLWLLAIRMRAEDELWDMITQENDLKIKNDLIKYTLDRIGGSDWKSKQEDTPNITFNFGVQTRKAEDNPKQVIDMKQ